MTRPRWTRRRLWAAALLLFVLFLALSVWLIGSPPPRKIVLATGDPDGGFAALGREYRDRLARMGLQVELVQTRGSLDNLQRLLNHTADVAFVQAGVARDLPGSERLCGLAAVGSEPLWVFARSNLTITSLHDLDRHTVAVGPEVSGTDALARLLLKEHGVTHATLRNLSMDQSHRALRDREVDAVLLVCSCDAPVIRDLIHEENVRLVHLRGQPAISRRFPYLRPVVLPERALDLRLGLPREDKPLLAPVTALVAREDLHPRVVEQLLMAAQAVHSPGTLVDEPGRFPSLEGMDLPPHVAAEKFMKTGESYAARLLPYWGVRLLWQARLLVLPLLALSLPFWRALPLLYTIRVNRILKRHYTALRDVERRIDRCDDPAELHKCLGMLDNLRTDLETLSRKLPAHLQRDVYHWRLHVALVRTEGRDRLRRLGDRPGGAGSRPGPGAVPDAEGGAAPGPASVPRPDLPPPDARPPAG